ncbi:MAG: zinc transport system substrate-binding protein [Lentisphaeria bacterium]|jgi:zinc transport system substrate-binding protein
MSRKMTILGQMPAFEWCHTGVAHGYVKSEWSAAGAWARLPLLASLTTKLAFAVLLIGSASVYAEKPRVLATIKPLALIVNDLAGDLVISETLLQGNTSPHHFSMKMRQARQLARADMLVWVGPEFEVFLQNEAQVKKPHAPLPGLGERPAHASGGRVNIALSSLLHATDTSAGDEEHESLDQREDHEHLHLWINPQHAITLARALARELKILLPDAAFTIDARVRDYTAELDALDKSLQQTMAPMNEVPFIVYHDGFGEFVDRYKLKQLASVTRAPDELVSARRIDIIKSTAINAACLIVDQSELSRAQRYARLFHLPSVAVDLLAANLEIDSYPQYLSALAESFLSCANSEALR